MSKENYLLPVHILKLYSNVKHIKTMFWTLYIYWRGGQKTVEGEFKTSIGLQTIDNKLRLFLLSTIAFDCRLWLRFKSSTTLWTPTNEKTENISQKQNVFSRKKKPLNQNVGALKCNKKVCAKKNVENKKITVLKIS